MDGALLLYLGMLFVLNIGKEISLIGYDNRQQLDIFSRDRKREIAAAQDGLKFDNLCYQIFSLNFIYH